MKLIRKSNVIASLLALFLITISCDQEFNTIGTTIISNNHFETSKTYEDVFTYNRKIAAVQTNRLPIYQLGRYTDPIYGDSEAQIVTQVTLQNVNPTFGNYTQEQEDNAAIDDNELTIQENETVTRVYLNIPFFSTLEETDEDGNRTFELDSIYGNLNASFNLSVEELTFYLGNLDPENNFETPKEYFSNEDFSPFTGNVVFDEMYSINGQEIVIYDEDDPETTENEAENVIERLDPRVRIALDPTFFQQTIIDAEDSEALANNNNFRAYLRGFILSATAFSDDILMLFDMSQATIEIEYNYNRVDTKSTDDTSDDEIVVENDTYTLNLSGNIINTFTNNPYPAEIEDQLDTDTNASRLYLKGGAGTLVEIKLFDEGDSTDNLDEIRANNWLVNEANLTFYVDRETLDNTMENVTEPQRLYLYDLENNIPLLDYLFDTTANIGNASISRSTYGGILERDEDDNGIRYKIRLTEHINNIIRRDSTNVRLGLVLTSDINNSGTSAGVLESLEEIDLTTASIINPLGTVLYGANPAVEEERRLRLEIYYTDPNN